MKMTRKRMKMCAGNQISSVEACSDRIMDCGLEVADFRVPVPQSKKLEILMPIQNRMNLGILVRFHLVGFDLQLKMIQRVEKAS